MYLSLDIWLKPAIVTGVCNDGGGDGDLNDMTDVAPVDIVCVGDISEFTVHSIVLFELDEDNWEFFLLRLLLIRCVSLFEFFSGKKNFEFNIKFVFICGEHKDIVSWISGDAKNKKTDNEINLA